MAIIKEFLRSFRVHMHDNGYSADQSANPTELITLNVNEKIFSIVAKAVMEESY